MSQQIAVQNLPISRVKPSKLNVRKELGDISELVLSIKSVGVLEPVIARPIGKEFEVIIGSRRLAAAKKAGLKTVPAIIRKLSDEEAIVESLTENLQRGDLSEEEIVAAYNTLHGFDEKKWTQDAFAKRMGKSQAWVASLLAAYRLLITLKKAGVAKGMTSHPVEEEKQRGIAPVDHLRRIEEGVGSIVRSGAITEQEGVKKRIEMAKETLDLPQEDLIRVINRAKMYPEKPVEKLKEEALGGIAVKTYIPAKVARQMEETTGRPVSEALTQVLERGLTLQPASLVKPPEGQPQGYATLEEPISAQYQHQREWNLKQLIGRDLSAKAKRFSFDFLTVGYSQKTMDDLLKSLKGAEVKVLVDVRKNPQSMYRPEFNKDALQGELKSKGMGYVHLPELGIPRELRDEVYGGKTSAKEVLDQYERDVLKNGGLHKLLESVKGKGTFAVMCTEVDPTNCHRHKIAEALTKEGLVGYDL
jgi:ParB/RepB/Spo0J family partition protein